MSVSRSIVLLTQIAKSLNDREAKMRSNFDAIRGYFSNEEGLLEEGWVIVSKRTGIFCSQYFKTENAAWTWLFNI